MTHATCGKCRATFDVTAELPAVFTCGNCGAEVRRPPPVRRPAVPQHHHYRAELESAAKKDKTAIYLATLAGVLLVAGAAFFFVSTGSKARDPFEASQENASEKRAEPPPAEPKVEPKSEPLADDKTATAAPPKPEPEPVETGSTELARVRRSTKSARTAQEHLDAAKFGRAQLATARKANAADAEIPEFERLIKTSFEAALEVDPDFVPVHDELGHVRYSRSETSKWAASDRTPGKLKEALEATMAAIAGERDVCWLSGADCEKHGGVLAEAALLHEDRGSTKVNWFYTRVNSAAKRTEGEIGHYFVADRNADAFDPLIFRPYLILVQKDPKRSSVDRAYEVVQLFRTLEDTWRRRYAKEIEFSGTRAAPTIILLNSQKDYAKYIQRHEAVVVMSAGHYEPWEPRRMVIYESSEEDERNVIFHEGTHVLFDHKNTAKDAETQTKQSMWFAEGIAEYFGGHGPTAERDPVTQSVIYEPGRINDTRLKTMALAKMVKKFIKFDELIRISRIEWNKRKEKDPLWAELTYAQGWALVYYLNHGESGKYQKDFVEYMKLELTGKSGMETFTEVFGKHGLDKIEKGYSDFIDYIIKKDKEKKIVGGKVVD